MTKNQHPTLTDDEIEHQLKKERARLRTQKSRQKRKEKGKERIEVLVDKAYKAKFLKMVEAKALAYPLEIDQRAITAKAKTALIQEALEGRMETFSLLTEDYESQIKRLKAEIAALSPQFFKTTKTGPLPSAIAALSDNAAKLKQLLAKTYQELQTTKTTLNHKTEKAQQAQDLADLSEDRIKHLETLLRDNGISFR